MSDTHDTHGKTGYPGLCTHTEDPHSEHLRAFRRMAGAGTFLITKCLEPRKPLLTDRLASAVCDTICREAQRERMLLAAFVVMPDHWHAVIGIHPNDSLAVRMGVISRWASEKTSQQLASAGACWQDGYHDTRIRSSKQFEFSVNYVRTNPVRAGIAEADDSWPHSSLNPLYADAVTQYWPGRFEYDA